MKRFLMRTGCRARYLIEVELAERKRLLDECFKRSELICSLAFDGESVNLKIANFSRACQLQAEIEALYGELDELSGS